MNVRRFLLLSIVVLLVCQLGFAQTVVVNKTSGLQQLNKALTTGKPQLVMPTAVPGTHARSMAIFSGQKLLLRNGTKPSNAPGEPWFCDWNYGGQILVCPKGVQTAYGTNFPGANGGAGMTIAIVDYFYYVDAESALAQYNADMHLPPCTVANGCFIPMDKSNGWECELCYGWEVETMLDIEAAHAMAPNAKIVYIGADPNGDGSNEELLAQSLGSVTSNSWTFVDQNNFGIELPYWEAYLGQGPPTLFASGDGSAFPYEGPAYPCTSPNATCVGGTSLYLNPNLTRHAEYGWGGGGGGCSGVFVQPTYQNYTNANGYCGGFRSAPDIAAIADPATAFAVYIGGYYAPYYYGVGGTSVATPILAGLVADMDAARVSFGKAKLTYSTFNGEIYPSAAYNYNYYFYDVTVGNNGYPAGPQFDLVTGLGVPNGKALASRFFGIP